MTHWFDRLSVRAGDGQRPFTRRTAVKAAAAGAVAASPLVTRAAAEAGALLRETPCQCQKAADKQFDLRIDGVRGQRNFQIAVLRGDMLTTLFFLTAIAAIVADYYAQKLVCGACPSNPSGSLNGGGGGVPCRPRGGTCPGPGPTCPPGTSPCADGLCCFGTDVCCSCAGVAQCCIVEIGCGCC